MPRKNDWCKVISSMKPVDDDIAIKTIAPHKPELLMQRPIVKALHGVAPREIKGKEWWDETRKLVYEKHNFHCIACGVHKTNAKEKKHLEAHEWYECDYENTKYTLKEIIPLCHYCHNYIHYQRSKAMLDCGNMTKAKYDAIFRHGDSVLKEIGLTKDYNLPEDHFPEKNGTWETWYLEFEGEKYYTKFKTPEEMDEYYKKKNEEME